MALPFLIAFAFVNSIILLPSCTYVSEKYFVMDNTTLLKLTPEGKQQEELSLPNCVAEISENAFKGNEKLRAVHFPSQITKISAHAFEEHLITQNLVTFYVPNSMIKKILEDNGVPPKQIVLTETCSRCCKIRSANN